MEDRIATGAGSSLTVARRPRGHDRLDPPQVQYADGTVGSSHIHTGSDRDPSGAEPLGLEPWRGGHGVTIERAEDQRARQCSLVLASASSSLIRATNASSVIGPAPEAAAWAACDVIETR